MQVAVFYRVFFLCTCEVWCALKKLGCASNKSYASFVLSKLPLCVVTQWCALRYESITSWTCFILQFDPVTSQDSTSTATCTTQTSSCSTSNTSCDKTQNTLTTATTVTVSPTVALTTSGGITSNIAMDTGPSETLNDSESSNLHETSKERSESSSMVGEQVHGLTSKTSASENSSTSDGASKKEPAEAPVPEPPLSPTGSLHSESGASATGVRMCPDSSYVRRHSHKSLSPSHTYMY